MYMSCIYHVYIMYISCIYLIYIYIYMRPPKSFFFSLNSKICLFAIRRGKQPAGRFPNSGETFR